MVVWHEGNDRPHHVETGTTEQQPVDTGATKQQPPRSQRRDLTAQEPTPGNQCHGLPAPTTVKRLASLLKW
jgi:hypothetical protein